MLELLLSNYLCCFPRWLLFRRHNIFIRRSLIPSSTLFCGSRFDSFAVRNWKQRSILCFFSDSSLQLINNEIKIYKYVKALVKQLPPLTMYISIIIRWMWIIITSRSSIRTCCSRITSLYCLALTSGVFPPIYAEKVTTEHGLKSLKIFKKFLCYKRKNEILSFQNDALP